MSKYRVVIKVTKFLVYEVDADSIIDAIDESQSGYYDPKFDYITEDEVIKVEEL